MYRWLIRGTILLGVVIGLWTGTAHAQYPMRRPKQTELSGDTVVMPGWTLAALAKWTGCDTVTHFVMIESPSYNAAYNDEKDTIYFTSALWRESPPEAVFIVLLHETYHCIQHQRGDLEAYDDDPVRLEQEADYMANEWACRLGHDGPRYERLSWSILADNLDEENSTHGTPRARLAHAATAPSCRRGVEAPYR